MPGHVEQLSRHVWELAAVNDFRALRGLDWVPPDENEIGDAYAEEVGDLIDA